MQNTWLVILPPLLVLLLSFATHRVVLSLFIGIASATLIYHDFSLVPAAKTFFLELWNTLELGNLFSLKAFINSSTLFIYLFLLFLGIIIALISHSGGTQAYANFVEKKLKNKKAAETASILLSTLFFVDEYLSILTVGSVMKPITDRFLVPRAKLAFLVNAMAAPLCIIVPLSSWCAYIFIQLEHSGVLSVASPETLIISQPFNFFMQTIPFAFFSFITVIATIFIVRKGISYGPMYEHEKIADESRNLYAGKAARIKQNKTENEKNESSLLSFLIPIVTLIVAVFIALYFTNFVAPPALFIGGTCSLLISTIFFLTTKKIPLKKLPALFWEGTTFTIPALIVVTLALTFSEILTNDLLTGQFLATQLTGTLSLFLLPLIFFVITTITTLAIGSAWGAMSVMVPIAIPMLVAMHPMNPPISLSFIPIAIPTISAVLAGSVAGIRFSPISDITIMASTSTGTYHMDHVKTQQAYNAPIFIGSCVGFLLSGLLISYSPYLNVAISLSTGIVITILLLSLFNRLQKKSK